MEIRNPLPHDIGKFRHRLRLEDAQELRMASGMMPYEALWNSIKHSTEAYCAMEGDEPVMIGGIALHRDLGIIWGVGSDALQKHSKWVLKNTRPFIRKWFERYPHVELLTNFSWAPNTLHHKWLRFAGAEFHRTEPRGPYDEPFVHFTINRSAYV